MHEQQEPDPNPMPEISLFVWPKAIRRLIFREIEIKETDSLATPMEPTTTWADD